MSEKPIDNVENAEEFVKDYFARMAGLLTGNREMQKSVCETARIWRAAARNGGRIIFMGNGGSAAIADHLAVDLSKNGGLSATCFSSAALITCLSNDYGHDHWMRHALRLNASKDDVLTIISSSGKSPNILAAIEQAKEMGMTVITLSGFSADNPMRRMGDLNMWLDCSAYNIVETVHQAWLVCAVDMIIGETEYSADRVVEQQGMF